MSLIINPPEHEQKLRKNVKPETAYDDTEFPHKLRNFSIATLLAVVVMTAYATATGIIQVWWLNSLCDRCPFIVVVVS